MLTKKLLGLMAACMIGGAAGSLLPAYAEETGEPTQAQPVITAGRISYSFPKWTARFFS